MNEVTFSIKRGMEYLIDWYETRSGELPTELKSRILNVQLKSLHSELMAIKQFHPDLDKFRQAYKEQIKDAILTYPKDKETAKAKFLFAMTTAFANVYLSAWVDGGATLPVNSDASQWLAKREEQERKNVEALFVTLAALLLLKKFNIDDWAEARAEGYSRTFDGIYNVGRMYSIMAVNPNTLIHLDGEDGSDSCIDCQRLKAEEHTVKWVIDNDYCIYPGNTSYACQNWRCLHFWSDRNGKQISMPIKSASFIHLDPTPPQIAQDPKDANSIALRDHNPRLSLYVSGIDIHTGKVMQAFIVDGMWIRNNIWADFTAGGNASRYETFIPENEIWLDVANMPEIDFNLIHETVEHIEMRDDSLDYPHAHSNYANDAEFIARSDPSKVISMLRSLGWQV